MTFGARSAVLAGPFDVATPSTLAARLATPAVRWIALLLLCSAYLQGGLTKLFNFESAIAEMNHFGLAPATPIAIATILLELAAPVAILSGRLRWLGALVLAAFTFIAMFIANRFWELSPPEQLMSANAFFEHLGLVGGFLLVAWHDSSSANQSEENV